MTDFEKLCEILKTEPTPALLERLTDGESLVIEFDENGKIKFWGVL